MLKKHGGGMGRTNSSKVWGTDLTRVIDVEIREEGELHFGFGRTSQQYLKETFLQEMSHGAVWVELKK